MQGEKYMNPLIFAEFVSIIYVSLTLIGNYMKSDKSICMKRLKLVSFLVIGWLLTDALSYRFMVPWDTSRVAILSEHFFHLMAFVMSNVVLFGFLLYSEAYLNEKAKLNKWTFVAPKIIAIIDVFLDIHYYLDGRMVVFKDGEFALIGTTSNFVLITYVLSLFFPPVVAFVKRKEVGKGTVFTLSFFGIPAIVSIIYLVMTGKEYSVLAGAGSVIFVAMSLQRDITRNEIEKYAAIQALAENSARMLALEDTFECLYDVELESGKYACYIKGELYEANVAPKLVESGDFFADLADNIEATIFFEDREDLYNTLTREAIKLELTGADHFDYYYRINTDEEPIWFKLRIVYKDAEKKNIIIGSFNASGDVEAKQIADQKIKLEEALELAEKANMAKSEFLLNMSHDIRTPMNAITGYTTIAKKYAGDEERVTDYLEKINASAQQLLTMINQVLEMSKIESGQLVLDEKPVNIQEQFDTLVTILSGQAQTAGIDFIYSLMNIKHYNVYADEARMSSITMNIIGNSLKFTPDGGTVRFLLEEIDPRKEGYATYKFMVADNGIGMSRKFQKSLFEPFSRENNTTVSKIQGTGLGTAIVKRLVDYLGGDISVKSEQGKGTAVTITVDLKICKKNVKSKEDEIDFNIECLKGKRALLVEDNEMNREIVKNILNEYGIIVEEADDGDISVKMVKEHVSKKEYTYYDYILMDIQMPRMDGHTATKKIRKLKFPKDVHVPIIATTANAFEEDKKKALDAGMDAHISKPINLWELLKTLAEYAR